MHGSLSRELTLVRDLHKSSEGALSALRSEHETLLSQRSKSDLELNEAQAQMKKLITDGENARILYKESQSQLQ